ncbi:hypothetical protein B0H63DRAFT_134327 [Podospora didyma]|uniref:Uncharacterized protein n=1 Tax=Podospora didyma TaxID=330526 RepID=A0AAE0P0S0_9PEZI|nr:hypothetical protein B0H63DRAFT_134327 [Podospora didyma]
MTDSNQTNDQNDTPSSCLTYSRSDPAPQELSRLISLKHDSTLGGVFSLGRDGVFRSLTADRRVVDAVGLTPEQVALWQSRWPEGSPFRNSPQMDEGADGTKVPVMEWYFPKEGVLPPGQSEEVKERMRRKREGRDEDPEKTLEEYRGRGMRFGDPPTRKEVEKMQEETLKLPSAPK